MYLRLDEVRRLGSQYVQRKGVSKTADSVLVQESQFSDWKTYDVFLSHSFDDAQLILGVVSFIEDQGKSVYVDWIVDKGLDRSKVTASTADLLRKRMRASLSLVYATSESSSKSKWMPWELGYFDGHKPGMVSILPLVQSSDSEWKGQEYLGLYSVVNRLEYQNNSLPFVVRPDTSAQRFSEFGKSANYIFQR